MDLVEIGQGAIFLGEIANAGDRRDVAVHRVDALEGDEFWPIDIDIAQEVLEVTHIVVPENALLAPRLADAVDHRRMIEFVGKDDAAGEQLADRPRASPNSRHTRR